MCAGMLFSLIFDLHGSTGKHIMVPFLSGIIFGLANFILYFLIKSNDITVASSFAEFNVLFFPVLLYAFNKKKTRVFKYIIGLLLVTFGLIVENLGNRQIQDQGNIKVTFGLIVENLVSKTSYILTPLDAFPGVFMGFLYAVATYAIYISIGHDRSSNSSIFYVFSGETVILFLFWSILKFKIYPALNIISITLSFIIAAALVIALSLEIGGYRTLRNIGLRQITIGNILTNLELLPVIAFAFILYPSLRIEYTI